MRRFAGLSESVTENKRKSGKCIANVTKVINDIAKRMLIEYDNNEMRVFLRENC